MSETRGGVSLGRVGGLSGGVGGGGGGCEPRGGGLSFGIFTIFLFFRRTCWDSDERGLGYG